VGRTAGGVSTLTLEQIGKKYWDLVGEIQKHFLPDLQQMQRLVANNPKPSAIIGEVSMEEACDGFHRSSC
jgi:hypothetical protein